MSKIKLITFDLDGTLLNNSKQITPATIQALERAANAGVELVPATGRFFNGMPEVIRKLPFLHYAITINGAEVYDILNDKPIARETFKLEQALALMRALDIPAASGLLFYDCYMDNTGWMTRAFQDQAEQLLPDLDPKIMYMIKNLRHPVDELKAFLIERANQGYPVNVQKVQCFSRVPELREQLLRDLTVQFPDIVVSTSTAFNIEFNSERAKKGVALKTLADYLGIDIAETMALGDDMNDLSMIKTAGLGVAMGNAKPEIKAVAKKITLSNDEDGVALAINEMLDV